MMSPQTATMNSAPAERITSRMLTTWPVGAPAGSVRRERVLRFRHANRQVTVAVGFEVLQLIADGRIRADVLCAVQACRDRLDLVPQRHVVGVERFEVGLTALADLDDVPGQILGTLSAVGPVCARERPRTGALRDLYHRFHLRIGIRDEAVDGDHRLDTELAHVLDVALQVLRALADGLDVLSLQVLLRNAAVHLECADGRDDYCR